MSDLRELVNRLSPKGRAQLIRQLVEAGTPEPERPSATEPVAVVGMGCRFPGDVGSPGEFWDFLVAGRDGVVEVPADRWDIEEFFDPDPEVPGRMASRWGGFLGDVAGFDAGFFGISPLEAAAMDPQQRMLLVVAWEALENAAISPAAVRGTAGGVFMGMSSSDYLVAGVERRTRIDAYTATGNPHSTAVGRLSYVLDLRGPSVAVDTACSSSLVALHQACQALRARECDMALAGGVHLIISPFGSVALSKWSMLSPEGRCKAFDAGANGFVRGEGCGVVVLKRLSDAVANGDRVLAVVRGSAVNQDGRSNGLTAPNPVAQRAVLEAALERAGVAASDVGLVESHGTGTTLGDPIEFEALDAVYGRGGGGCALGAVKSNFGHLEAAAGVAGFIKAVLCVRAGAVPPNLHFTRWNPAVDASRSRLFVPTEAGEWPTPARTRLAGVSSFGFGGTNAHIIVEQPPEPASDAAPARPVQIYPLSGESAAQVRRAAGRLADWLEDTATEPAAVASTLARRGAVQRVRLAVAARDRDSLLAGLRDAEHDTESPALVRGEAVPPGAGIAFVFPGQGSQWPGMARRLLAEEPAFAAAVAELDPLMREHAGFGLRDVLESGEEPREIARLQPVLFGVQVALARLWQAYGVTPAAVIGHSMGEVAAAVVAGALPPDDGLRVIVRRSRLLSRVSGRGAMAALALSASEAGDLVAAHPGVELAVYSSPSNVVVSGDAGQVARIVAEVEGRGVLARTIRVDVASHSAQVDDLLPALGDELAGLGGKPPETAFYSTVLADPREVPAFDAGYWQDNLRAPVRFEQAVSAALDDGFRAYVEISTHPVLTHAVTDIADARGAGALVTPTLRRDEDDTLTFHAQRARLHCHGQPGTPLRGPHGAVVDLPTTPWEHTRAWLDGAPGDTVTGVHPLLGVHVPLPDGGRHAWHADVGTAVLPWLADHRVNGTTVILPGAAFAEMALTAAASCDAGTGGIEDLALHEPLAVEEHTAVTTTLDAGGRIEVHARGRDGRWRLHASAVASTGAPGEAPPADRPPGDVTEDGRDDAEDLYRRIRATGQVHGPAFRGLTSIVTRTAGEACARVRLPETTEPHPRFHWHPVLLDTCLQALMAAAPEPGADDEAYLPVEIGRVRVWAPPPRAGYCRVRLRSSGDDWTGEVRLFGEDGRLHAEATGVFLRRMDRSAMPVSLDAKLFTLAWEAAPLPGALPSRGPRGVLVLAGHDAADHDGLRADEVNVVTGRLDDVRDAVAEASAGPPLRDVVILAPPGTAGEPGDAGALEETRRFVVAVARAAGVLGAAVSTPPRLWLVTRGGPAVAAGETPDPAQACLRALVRVLAFENPGLRATVLDTGDDTDALARELAAGAGDDEIAWRGGVRHRARVTRTAVPEPASAPVRTGGGYVVTGGLGGLGLVVARSLVDEGAGRVILSGRSGPTDEQDKLLDELRGTGADVRVVTGDVAAPGTAERLVEAASAGGVRLCGVIHAAAVLDDAVLTQVGADAVQRIWAPKVTGAWRLHEATAGLDLDWWVVFSSAAALFGSPGQGAYAAANAWLDAFTQWRRARGLPAMSVAWGPWAEVGLAKDQRAGALEPLTPEEGVEALRALLARPSSDVTVARMNTARVAAEYPEIQALPFFAGLLAESGDEPGGWAGIAAARAAEPAEARRIVGQRLDERVAGIMGYPAGQMKRDVPLTSLGVDSLMAVRIKNAVQQDLQVALPVAVLLQGTSLTELRTSVFELLDIAEAAGEPAEPDLVGRARERAARRRHNRRRP